MAQKRKEKPSIVEPALRRDFWECLISRHPIEEDYARPTKNAYRWRRLPKLRLVIGQFVSQYGVGVFVRGERGDNPEMVAHRLRPHAAKLKKAVGANKFYIVGGGHPPAKYFFQKFKNFNSSNFKNWNRMADWLHREADAYQVALYKVVGTRTKHEIGASIGAESV